MSRDQLAVSTISTVLKSTEKHIIREIKNGNGDVLKGLYRQFRNEFIVWSGRQFGATEEQAKDVFQDAVIAFYQNVVSGQLSELTSSVKTYLFEIGKRKMINLRKREQRLTYEGDPHLINRKEKEDYMNEENKAYSQEQLRGAISKLPEDCQRVLKLFYFREYDMESIAREMGYKNADTAKSKKSICMKKLLAELQKLTMLLVL